MGKRTDHIPTYLMDFISKQKMFFVGTAANEGRVNISPKGLDSLRVIDKNKIVWLNLTGGGNETAAHMPRNNRMTIMFCDFDGNPLILRLYGHAIIFHNRDSEFHDYMKMFEPNLGARQIIEMDVDLVQTSCGFGVPLLEFKEQRTALNTWSEKHGKDGILEFWKDKNSVSIDGYETKIMEG